MAAFGSEEGRGWFSGFQVLRFLCVERRLPLYYVCRYQPGEAFLIVILLVILISSDFFDYDYDYDYE